MSIYSNDNIRKIAKLTTRELPQKSKNAKITVCENNGLYSIIKWMFIRGTSQVPVYFVCASIITTQLTDLGHLIQHIIV